MSESVGKLQPSQEGICTLSYSLRYVLTAVSSINYTYIQSNVNTV